MEVAKLRREQKELNKEYNLYKNLVEKEFVKTNKIIYQLKNAGVISGYDSTVESAVTKLMHLQGHYSDSNIIRMKMNQNLRGEISLRKEE